MMKKLVVGILAHVDAGKTTLSEGLLYRCGNIKKLGRVDHQDAFLDNNQLERQRGITIFSKQALLSDEEMEICLLDTPGHIDFSAEMERTLQVLDYAVLVISGSNGVQSHTKTLWRLLKRYAIPTFLFVNKMDLPGSNRVALLEEMETSLHSGCVDFGKGDVATSESLALCDEALMEEYLEKGEMHSASIARAIQKRKVFPCFFGSALRLEGVEEFWEGLKVYTRERIYPQEFGAKVFKITHDSQGNRLTHLKLTGGSLRVKELLEGKQKDTAEPWSEKIDQIRLYSGAKYRLTEEVSAGTVCVVTGLTQTYSGEGLGMERESEVPVLEPVLNYQMLLPVGINVHETFLKLAILEEEDPQLHLVWNERWKEIHVQLMGEVQLEILRDVIRERFGLAVSFGPGHIVYKETIRDTVVGIGHFEPLRHYAEVHLLLEPGERGSGLVFDSVCSEDVLDRNWQRLILTHLEERAHLGVLTGSPITDIKITLLIGRAHLKHTEGGDFREATYRAVRQGLMQAQSALLEPYYDFRIEVPTAHIGRAMSDVQMMFGSFQPPETEGELSVLVGNAPVSTMHDYSMKLTAYTKGLGRFTCSVRGYDTCHNEAEVIAAANYDPEADLPHTPDSVFCAHGAGFVVKWDEVPSYAHLDSSRKETESYAEISSVQRREASARPRSSLEEDKELMAIFERTYGPVTRKTFRSQTSVRQEEKSKPEKVTLLPSEKQEEYLLVDGYNIIYAWEDLAELARDDLSAARECLIQILCNFQGFKKCNLILVFDAYKVHGGVGSVEKYRNISVIYTKEAETADMYIEKVTYEIAKKHHVRVATSDNLEQIIILGHGAVRVSARSFLAEVQQVEGQISDIIRENNRKNKIHPTKLKDTLK